MFGAGIANGLQVAVLDSDGLLDIVCVEFLLERGFELRAVGALYPERIARDQRLTEYGEIGTRFCGFAYPFADLGKRRVAL